MTFEYDHVDGDDRGNVVLFALSTCIWCKKTKQLLTDMGIAYDYVFVDLLDEGPMKEARTELEKWNPRCSFPTLVLNDKDCIIGYQEDRIREALA